MVKIMSVEHATGESAKNYYGHTFASVDEAIEYLKREGGGIIEIEEIDIDASAFNESEYAATAQLIDPDYDGERLIVVETES